MSAECSMCGDCCDPVTLAYTKPELRRLNPSSVLTAQDIAFILEHFRQMSAKEGLLRSSSFNGRFDNLASANAKTGELVARGDRSVFYECEFFDTEPLLGDGTRNPTFRMCTAHEKRPPLCRRYPWPTDEDVGNPQKFLPVDCSYRADQIAVKLTTKPNR